MFCSPTRIFHCLLVKLEQSS